MGRSDVALLASIGLPVHGAPVGARPEPSTPHDAALEIAAGSWDEPLGRSFRRIYCRHYDRCLAHVAGVGKRAGCTDWQGFTCRACPVVDELTREERARQDHRIAAALSWGREGTGDEVS